MLQVGLSVNEQCGGLITHHVERTKNGIHPIKLPVAAQQHLLNYTSHNDPPPKHIDRRTRSAVMTDPTPPAPTVDDLKKKLDPILVKIRSLRAEVDTLEHQTRQRLMAVQSMVQNGIPMQIGSEVLPKALAIIGDNTQAIIRLKTRIQFLGKFKGKLKGQVCTAKSTARKEHGVR